MKSVLYIGNKLSRIGYTPGVIETLGRQLEEAGYKVYYAGTLKNQYLRLFQMIYKTFTKGRKADCILIDTYSTSAFWYAYITGRLAKFIGKKYIPILHGGNLPERLKRSRKACDKLFKHSYTNVAVSGYLQKEFENRGYPVILIPNNINIASYRFKSRENPAPALLWVRAFSKEYNAKMAADVLSELLKNYPDARLCMVGPDRDGSMAEFIAYSDSRGVTDKIQITGKLLKEEWIKLSENYDFFINTTNIDNTPVSVIEAMALGLIVVSTNPGGISFLLKENGDSKLVAPGDVSAMAEAISALIKDPDEAVRLATSARGKAESFSSDKIIDLWIKLLS